MLTDKRVDPERVHSNAVAQDLAEVEAESKRAHIRVIVVNGSLGEILGMIMGVPRRSAKAMNAFTQLAHRDVDAAREPQAEPGDDSHT